MRQLLKQLETKFHPLNKYLVKQQPKNIIERSSVKILTYNICLVPWIADVCFPTPHVRSRLEEFILNHLAQYDIVCL